MLKNKKILYSIIIIAVSFLAYANALLNDFTWDDLSPSTHIDVDIKNPLTVYTKDYWDTSRWEPARTGYYRPLTYLSYALDKKIWKGRPAGYHLTNILGHVACSLLLFLFLNLIFSERKTASAAFWAALIFAVHPIHTEAVTWVSGRTDLFATLFILAALILYHYSFFYTQKRAFLYTGTLICFIAALHFKEAALVLPLLAFGYSLLFIDKEYRRDLTSKLIHRQIPMIAVFIPYFFHRLYVIGKFTGSPAYHGGSFHTALLSMIKVVPFYIKMLVVPVRQSADHIIEPAVSVFEPGVVFSSVFILVILAGTVLAYRKNKIIFFSAAWFFVALIPVSNVVFPLLRFVGERYLYLPSVGFAMLAGYGFVNLPKLLPPKLRNQPNKNTLMVIPVFYALILFALTVNRNTVWRNDYTLWRDTVRKSPKSVIAHANLSLAYEKMKMVKAAERQARIAIALKPDLPESYYNLAGIFQKIGKLNDAEMAYRKALELQPKYMEAASNLAVVYAMKGELNKGITLLEKAIRIAPNEPALYINLAKMHREAGNNERAQILEIRARELMSLRDSNM